MRYIRQSDIETWRGALLARRTSLAGVDANRQPRIEGIAIHALETGVLVRLRADDDGELTFTLNPIAARILVVAIVGEAQRAGWMDEGLDVLVTEPDPQ